MIRTLVVLCGTILFLMSADTGNATHPLISDDAGTLGKGTVQIELNGDIGTDRQTRDGSRVTYKSSQIASTAGVGLSDRLDLTFGVTRPWGSGSRDGVSFNDSGSTDFTLNMKWRLYEHEGVCVAVKPQLGYSYAVGARQPDFTISYGTTLIVSKEFEPFAFHLNAGYTFNAYNLSDTRDANRSSIWSVSLATTYDVIKERLKVATDFGAASSIDKAVRELPVFGLAGLIYSVNKNIDLSAGAKVGLTNAETDFTGTFGISYRY
ncbi:MAG TPA: transporter [Desulfuromonadales bacterium]|nr:transporter [Desulfuromonadales bacterium]